MRRFAVGTLLLLALAPAAPAAARRSVPRDFYAAVFDREVASAPAAVQDAQWSTMARAGVESVRAVFSWADAQPDAGSPPSFAATDATVARAARHGIDLLPLVIGAPRWARLRPDADASPPAHPDDYAAYLRALVARYGRRGTFWPEHPELPRRPVRAWQVWNEPQLRFQWSEHDWERGYGELLRAAYPAVKQADPRARVVLAGATNYAWTALASLYAKGGIKGFFDVAALHPYTGSARHVLKAVQLFRAVLRRHGDGRKPVWITELGWPASRGRAAPPPGLATLTTTDRGMARRLARAYRLLARGRRKARTRVTRVYWYTWASSYDASQGIFAFTGLGRFAGGSFRAKPALAAYRASARRAEGCAKTAAGACRRR